MGGRLFTDALSGPDGPAPTYLALMRHNVVRLRDAMLAE
jgi:zinc/manganese transport system substrate-binding protein